MPPRLLLRISGLDAVTDRSYGVADAEGKLHWLPRSEVDLAEIEGEVRITVPRWLADRHGALEFEET